MNGERRTKGKFNCCESYIVLVFECVVVCERNCRTLGICAMKLAAHTVFFGTNCYTPTQTISKKYSFRRNFASVGNSEFKSIKSGSRRMFHFIPYVCY